MGKPVIDIDLRVESNNWPDSESMAEMASRALQAAAAFLSEETAQPFGDPVCEVSVLLTDDAAMQILNRTWRKLDKPTNVLSFPTADLAPGDRPGLSLGDIVLARETVCRQAAELGKPLEHHVSHLMVHGFLHLLGYDHENAQNAELMERFEARILARLGLSNPYLDHDPV